MRPLSPRNPKVAQLDRLVRHRRERAETGAFVVDGPVLAAEALDAGLRCVRVVLDATRDRAVDDLAARAEAVGAEVVTLDAATFARVTDPVTPQGIAIIVERPQPAADLLAHADLVVVLDAVQDPGNVGTLIRVAGAVAADAVVLTTGTADAFAPKTVRASAGAVLRVPVIDQVAAQDVLARLHTAGLTTVATAVDGGTPHDALDLTCRVAVVLGNEAHGLAAEQLARADERAHIVMPGEAESLNVAMAGTVICFEALRQRRAAHHRLDPNPQVTKG